MVPAVSEALRSLLRGFRRIIDVCTRSAFLRLGGCRLTATLSPPPMPISFYLYISGIWLRTKRTDRSTHDFTCAFPRRALALHGEMALIYIRRGICKAQDTLVGSGNALFSIWPYPPTYFLILAPLTLLPYLAAFLTWVLASLLGYVAVVYSDRTPAGGDSGGTGVAIYGVEHPRWAKRLSHRGTARPVAAVP